MTPTVDDEKFQRQWMQYYLETHPKFQGQEITEELLEKWMDGATKGCYVSCLGEQYGSITCLFLL